MRLGIRGKAIAIPTAILLAAVAANAFVSAARFREEYSQALKSRVVVIGHNLRLQMERLFQLGIDLHAIEGYDEQCREVLRLHPDLSYAMIVEPTGKVLFHSDPAKRGTTVALAVQAADGAGELPATDDSRPNACYGIHVPIASPSGEVQAHAVIGFPRSLIDAKVHRITLWSIGVAVLLVMLAVALLWLSLSSSVTRPLSMLLDAIEQIRSSGHLGSRVHVSSSDEIGRLAMAFNGMVESIRDRDDQIRQHVRELQQARDELEMRVLNRTADLSKANEDLRQEIARRQEAERKREQMHIELMDASRKAGMADVATGVLHNVGNVLNSVNVSATLARDRLKQSRLPSLLQVVDLVEQHHSDLPQFLGNNEQGRQVPPLIAKLAKHLAAEHQSIAGELDALGASIDHIKDIVSMQQTLARTAGAVEEFAAGEVIEDALRINLAGLHRHEVNLIREYDTATRLTTDRHKVLQVLINLISNAKYAVTASGKPDRRVLIRVQEQHDDVTVEVIDNGVGIEPQNMEKIFHFAFTTKQHGHGFGLHSSALAAKELGGSLTAHSSGPGAGATFRLRIPKRFRGDEHG